MDHQWAASDGDPRTGQGPEKDQECRRDRNTPGQRHCETPCLQFRFMVSSSMARIIAVSRSSSPTHDTHWRPGPTRPPRPNRTSCASFAVPGRCGHRARCPCAAAPSHARQTVTISRGPMPVGVEHSSRTASPPSPKTASDDDCTHIRGRVEQRPIASPTTRTGWTRDEMS